MRYNYLFDNIELRTNLSVLYWDEAEDLEGLCRKAWEEVIRVAFSIRDLGQRGQSWRSATNSAETTHYYRL